VTPEKLDLGDDLPALDHYVERLEGCFLRGREPRDPLNQELPGRSLGHRIDVLGITSWHQWVMIVWHPVDMPDDG
jgi:hypothetical protein